MSETFTNLWEIIEEFYNGLIGFLENMAFLSVPFFYDVNLAEIIAGTAITTLILAILLIPVTIVAWVFSRIRLL